MSSFYGGGGGGSLSKKDLDAITSKIFKFKVVASLPTEEISDSTIYLINTGEEENNFYTEYVYIDNNWEKFGTQKVDLSNYVISQDLALALETKADKEDIPDVSSFITADVDNLTNYYRKDTIDNAFNLKVDKDGNKVLTDINYSVAEQEKVNAAYEARHTHDNKAVLDGITEAKVRTWDAAQPNVNADWESDSGDSQILHKPAHLVQDADYVHTDNNFTNACKDKLTGIEAGAQVNTVTGVKGSAENDYRTGNIELSKTDIGLGNVNNTADADKPISTATQTALDGKSDAGHTHDDRYYTESEIDVALADKAEASHSHDDRYYTEAEMDAALGNKSNIGHTHDDRYYTEAETDALLDGKADAADIPDVSSFITRLVSDLANYYTKSETYTQAEINALVSAIPKFAIEVVSVLPTEDISPTTVYLLTSQTQENGNLYTEYLYVGHSWELLGSQTVDLSGYYTKEQIDSLISGLPVAGHTHDDRYYTESEIDAKVQTLNTAIGGKAASDHQHDDRYYTESEVDTLLSRKANTGHTHDAATQSAAGFMSAADKTKLDGIESGAEANVQSDWNQSDTTADDFIKNKPTNASASAAGLMSAADFKKINAQNITSGSDLNDIKGEGWYYCSANSTAATLSHCPTDKAFYLEVHKHAGVYQHIVEFTPIGAKHYHRNYYNYDNVWGNWVEWKLTDTTYSAATTSAAGLMSAADKTKLDEIQTGARANVQADWTQDDSTADDYILHKPDLSQLPKFSIKVVSDLPVSDISYTTIYLVPITNSTSPDMYTEYIRVKGENGASDAWEALGTQTVDLSDYVTTGTLNNALANKANSAHTHTKAQITDLTIDSTPTENSTNPVTSGGVFNAINAVGKSLKIDTLFSQKPTNGTPITCNFSDYPILIFAFGWGTQIRNTLVIPLNYFQSTSTSNAYYLFDVSSIDSNHHEARNIKLFKNSGNTVCMLSNWESTRSNVTCWCWGIKLE